MWVRLESPIQSQPMLMASTRQWLEWIYTIAQAEQAKAMKGKKVSLPLVLENTIAGTVWISPNSKGGITICQPEEN